MNVFLTELRYFGGDNRSTVRLIGVVGKILLMIILGRPEFIEGGDLSHDRVVVNALSRYLRDDIFGGSSLFLGAIKDRGPVGRTYVVPLSI